MNFQLFFLNLWVFKRNRFLIKVIRLRVSLLSLQRPPFHGRVEAVYFIFVFLVFRFFGIWNTWWQVFFDLLIFYIYFFSFSKQYSQIKRNFFRRRFFNLTNRQNDIEFSLTQPSPAAAPKWCLKIFRG